MLLRTSRIAALLAWCPASVAFGQVVQLPTFESFSVGTTVVVPDRGAAYLGGVKRASYGGVSHGVPGFSKMPGIGRLFRNRGSGASVRSSGLYATATVIDLSELDEAVLAAAAGRKAAVTADSPLERRAAFLTRHIDRGAPRRGDGLGPPSVGGDVARQAEAQVYLETGRRAEAAGRLGAARCNYRRVARIARGELREKALARLAVLRAPGDGPALVLRPAR